MRNFIDRQNPLLMLLFIGSDLVQKYIAATAESPLHSTVKNIDRRPRDTATIGNAYARAVPASPECPAAPASRTRARYCASRPGHSDAARPDKFRTRWTTASPADDRTEPDSRLSAKH